MSKIRNIRNFGDSSVAIFANAFLRFQDEVTSFVSPIVVHRHTPIFRRIRIENLFLEEVRKVRPRRETIRLTGETIRLTGETIRLTDETIRLTW